MTICRCMYVDLYLFKEASAWDLCLMYTIYRHNITEEILNVDHASGGIAACRNSSVHRYKEILHAQWTLIKNQEGLEYARMKFTCCKS